MSWINVHRFALNENLSALINALNSQHIPCKIIEYGGMQVLQVPNETFAVAARTLIAQWQAGTLQIAEADPSLVPPAHGPSLTAELWRFPVTLVLLVLSITGFVLAEFAALESLALMLTFFTVLPANDGFYILPIEQGIGSGQLWRLITPAFLHFGVLHIVFNGLWLWELGRRVEFAVGRLLYLLFFLITAAFSNLAQYFWQAEPAFFGGMSGVVYALVGYIAIYQRFYSHPALNVPPGIIVFMLAWLVLCLSGIIDAFIDGGIANGAHVGGLVAGALLGLLAVFFTAKNKQSQENHHE
ncbi:MAG TPA: rhomboid family intramembrane serine protease [Cellvibrionaceae bacterium]